MFILLAACTSTTGDSGGPFVATCDTEVVETLPTDQATDAYYRGPFEFVLEEAVDTAEVIADFPGVQGLRKEGTVITFTPDPPLEPNTQYTMGLDYCHGTPEISFATGELGLPLEDEDLLGASYVIDLTSGEFLESDLVGTVLTGFFGRNVLVQVVEQEGDSIVFRAAISQTGDRGGLEQDLCRRTQDIELDASELPYIQLDLEQLSFGAYEDSLTFYRFALNGTVSPDGSTIGGMQWSVTVSANDMVHILEVDSVDTVCETAAQLGAQCVPCPEGTDQCITVSGHQVYAEAIEADLDSIAAAGDHPECDDEE